ncbi:MAG: hypothetical protein ACO1N0_11020 [Fluviicola sp.]
MNIHMFCKTNRRPLLKIAAGLVSLKCVASCIFFSDLTHSDRIKEWNIDNYTITYSKKNGPAGGAFYQYDIYKGKKHLSYAASLLNKDSCLLRFREKNDYYVDFNLCSKTKTILRPDKQKLDWKAIDSITIRPTDSIQLIPTGKPHPGPYFDTIRNKNFDPTYALKLNDKELKAFVKKWNNSKADGINERNKKSYQFQLTIYTGKSIRVINTSNYFLIDESVWSYESEEDDFFNKLWNRKKQ